MEFDLSVFVAEFARTFTFWWVILPALLLGLIVGAIPGFSAANTIIILLPLTLAMDPEVGLIFMIALYASSRLGAGIPAILVNIPGTAGAAATPLDGYPMTKQGRGQQALSISFVSSVLGGLLTTIVALFAMPWLSQVAYYLHSVEMIVIMIFGISLIASIAAKDTLKGLIAGFFGLMIGYIGADVVYEDNVHIIDDLDGDEFSLVELGVALDEKLNISLDEVKILEVGTVGDLIALVESHVQSD